MWWVGTEYSDNIFWKSSSSYWHAALSVSIETKHIHISSLDFNPVFSVLLLWERDLVQDKQGEA